MPDIDLDHVVVRFRSLTADLPSRLARAGARIARSVPGTSWTELSTPNRSARQVRDTLARDPAIAQVSFSYIRHASAVPNDPKWSTAQSSYLAPLRLDRAWDLGKGSGVTVAVIDTGADLDHPDLAGQLVAGRNVLHPGAPPQDDNGHGTMVSGVVAARTNNSRGVVGVAPSAKVMPIKVLNSDGAGNDADIAVGIDWARTHHAQVINLSLGGAFDDPMLADAVQNAEGAGIVVVAAAGNDSTEAVGFPAGDPGVIAVSASGHDGALASFSSYGWRVDVAAPGIDITSTALGGTEQYATESGTSFSSPIVAGVAALVRGKHPTWTQAQVAAQIRNTARDVGAPGVDAAFGNGIVDPLAALGGPAAAPHPAVRSGADEPNDTPSVATALTIGTSHSASITPETDEDWYRVHFTAAGWYSVHVPSGVPSFAHQMDPLIELYKPDHSFTASQDLAGGDLTFDITVPGDYFVRVANVNGSTASYSVRVSAVAKPATFAPSLDVDFGTPAQSVGVADVDGDGRKDALVAFGDSSAFPDSLVVFKQTPTRSLALLAVLPTAVMTGGGMATGDLDHDGSSDVAIPTNTGIDVFTHIGAASTPTFFTAPRATGLAIADVDGDGNNDIVAAGPSGVRVYWGPAPFGSSPAFTQVTATATTGAIALADVSNHLDGRLDVVTCCVRVYPQSALRTFAAATTHAVTNAADVAAGDLNGDTRPDVVASVRSSSGAVSRLIQNGGGGLAAPVASAVATRPEPIAVADVDGDGKNDIVVLHDFDSTNVFAPPAAVGWLRQTSAGVFGTERTFPIDDFNNSYDPQALAVGDLDGDGRADVLTATGYGISILVQNSGVLPTLDPEWVIDSQPRALATNIAPSVHPTVTLGRAATNVNGTTAQLRDAAGNQVPTTTTYNSTTHVVTITPNASLSNGRYAIHLAGLTDAGGNTLAAAGTAFIVGPALDETAPQTTLHSPPSGTRSTASATLSFSANDPTATFSCSLDNAPYRACHSPQTLTTTAGAQTFHVFARDAAGNEDPSPAVATWTYRPPPHGYWMLGAAGAVYHFGTVPDLGGAAITDAVDFDVTPSGFGYLIVDAQGRVRAFGDAHTHGNAPALDPFDSVTSISRTASGNGYWLFTARGRVYSFGDAHFYGDMRNVALNGPVLDAVRAPSGHGYYMVGSDGGVFAFGDAQFHGSTGNLRLNQPVRSLVPDPDGAGYWLVARDGGVFAFDAGFRGSMGGTPLNRPIVGMVSFGNGYLMVGADGGIFDFSTKPFFGSLGGNPPPVPIVSVAAFA